MLNESKKIAKKLLPGPLVSLYHTMRGYCAALWFGFPSKQMVVIGVTGTKGKTTTANFIWSVLESGGHKAGLIGTANIRIGRKEDLNYYHMTMPDAFILQSLLRKMVKHGCTHVVLEATSEGLKQGRHTGIAFDVAVFTNLTPEHLPSHGGSFEKYRNEKSKLFKSLAHSPEKMIGGKKIPKAIIVNADAAESDYFLQFPAGHKATFGINAGEFRANTITSTQEGVDFTLGSHNYHIPMLGNFNVYNALPAIIIGELLEIPLARIIIGISSLSVIPGRMERIEEGQDFTVMVDYAHEKVSMHAVLDTAKSIVRDDQAIIVLLGAEGGGRDTAKRALMGEAAGTKATHVIVTNVDPYDDDPKTIAEDIARAAESVGKKRGKDLMVILDRGEAIAEAFRRAKRGDVVLITGKGAEQSMIIGGENVPWDDRTIVRNLLRKNK